MSWMTILNFRHVAAIRAALPTLDYTIIVVTSRLVVVCMLCFLLCVHLLEAARTRVPAHLNQFVVQQHWMNV